MQSVDALAVKTEEGRFKPAKVIGEVARTYDPVVSEWGNLTRFIWLFSVIYYGIRELGELKYLSTQRKRNRMRTPK